LTFGKVLPIFARSLKLMRKEVLFAILAGAILGIIIAFGVWRANISLQKEVVEITPTPTPTSQSAKLLTVAKPENYQVITSIPTSVTGISAVNSHVVISTDNDDFLIKTNNKGEFQKDIELNAGFNSLQFSLIGENIYSENISLIYSTQLEKTDDQDLEPDPEATDAVRQKVQEKLNKASEILFAYTGVVTDISENTLQLKNNDLGILQVSYNKETDFAEDGKDILQSSDIAIGDYLLAMGSKNSETMVLNAIRVVVTEETKFTPWTVVIGSISELGSKNIVITTSSETSDLTLTKKSNYPDDLEEENQVIVISNNNEVRTIFLADPPKPSL